LDIHGDPEPGKEEKMTRFGCGAILGLLVGGYLVLREAYASFGLCIAVIVAAVLICGLLALKYGDEFWHFVLRLITYWR
jgi:hypothetical protein